MATIRASEEGVLRQAQDERILRQAQDERILRQARDERTARQARKGGRARPERRASVRWSEALGESFLAILSMTGNARQAALELGAPYAFANRMRRYPAFRRRAREAAAEADERLRGAESPFPPPVEVKSMPPGDGAPAGGRRRPPPPPTARATPLDTDAEALGGMLRPGRKRKPSRPQPVLRRNSQGRMQVTLALDGHWTEEIEADFLARLAATGNFDACARAVGFQPASVKARVRKWAAFRRDCERALEEADTILTYRLTAHAHALLRTPGEAEAAGIEEEEVPFDPVMAMKILSHLDSRKYGRSGRGRRKGPPERTFEQACDSILAKIEAIERHERLIGKEGRGEGGSGSNPPRDPGPRRDDAEGGGS